MTAAAAGGTGGGAGIGDAATGAGGTAGVGAAAGTGVAAATGAVADAGADIGVEAVFQNCHQWGVCSGVGTADGDAAVVDDAAAERISKTATNDGAAPEFLAQALQRSLCRGGRRPRCAG